MRNILNKNGTVGLYETQKGYSLYVNGKCYSSGISKETIDSVFGNKIDKKFVETIFDKIFKDKKNGLSIIEKELVKEEKTKTFEEQEELFVEEEIKEEIKKIDSFFEVGDSVIFSNKVKSEDNKVKSYKENKTTMLVLEIFENKKKVFYELKGFDGQPFSEIELENSNYVFASKKVLMNFKGFDGNHFLLIGEFKRRAREQGLSFEEIDFILEKEKTGTFEGLVKTLSKHTIILEGGESLINDGVIEEIKGKVKEEKGRFFLESFEKLIYGNFDRRDKFQDFVSKTKGKYGTIVAFSVMFSRMLFYYGVEKNIVNYIEEGNFREDYKNLNSKNFHTDFVTYSRGIIDFVDTKKDEQNVKKFLEIIGNIEYGLSKDGEVILSKKTEEYDEYLANNHIEIFHSIDKVFQKIFKA